MTTTKKQFLAGIRPYLLGLLRSSKKFNYELLAGDLKAAARTGAIISVANDPAATLRLLDNHWAALSSGLGARN